ncbi:hypothetical protein [Methylobacterium gnaphalii]|uniref:Uncharacterized protein n=1 Tax=Methylobacterium gnaphalii TaxID=1010610 RepID=A0A512JP04_9HYPH|nr:hypothetical protein [Methylobacterium gnaphalii]GEP11686.1 hypothetical protein MGN01_35310 [Methylobacterium gnaphalii]GJD71337.1 hypothetical protein MMMDOFMJ_4293 [Methylobacterium gnaphalii]GLS50184.1 hypothetical protein GCM10007885_30360 [Methylobacterium gnaphalii]
MRAPDPLSAARGIIFGVTIGLILWAAIIALVVGIAHDRAGPGELITLTRGIRQ